MYHHRCIDLTCVADRESKTSVLGGPHCFANSASRTGAGKDYSAVEAVPHRCHIFTSHEVVTSRAQLSGRGPSPRQCHWPGCTYTCNMGAAVVRNMLGGSDASALSTVRRVALKTCLGTRLPGCRRDRHTEEIQSTNKLRLERGEIELQEGGV